MAVFAPIESLTLSPSVRNTSFVTSDVTTAPGNLLITALLKIGKPLETK
jgi:hypothetical protein